MSSISSEADKYTRIYREAKRDLINYRRILLVNEDATEVAPAPFHPKWSDILLKGNDHYCIEAFRESAKSQYVIRAFPLYCCTFPEKRRQYIVIIKKNETLARGKLLDIISEYKSNESISPNLIKINEESSKVFDLTVEDQQGVQHKIRMEAYGKGSSIRGLSKQDRRPDIVIADDLQDIKDSESETIMDKDWRWFLSDVIFLGKHTRLFLIGNNLGEKCIIEQVFAEAENLKLNKRFIIERIPALDYATGEANWPEMHSKEDLEAEKESYRKLGKVDIWQRERMCQALGEHKTFQRPYFRYSGPVMDQGKIAAECNIYIRTDMADENIEGCQSVIEAFGIDQENNWFIFEIVNGWLDPTEFINELFRMVQYWKPINVGLENVGLKVMEHFIYKEMKRRNVFFTIMREMNKSQKEVRIKAYQPRFKIGSVWFPDEAPWLAELESQLLLFPKGKRNDIIDTLGYNEQETNAPMRTKGPLRKNKIVVKNDYRGHIQ